MANKTKKNKNQIVLPKLIGAKIISFIFRYAVFNI